MLREQGVPTRIAVIHEPAERARERCPALGDADLVLDWVTDQANVIADWSPITDLASAELPPLCLDLLDIVTALYISDIAVRRGEREAWTRNIELLLPVREVGFWNEAETDLQALLYALTRDNFGFTFCDRQTPQAGSGQARASSLQPLPPTDCVSLLSGGLDSLAGAVMLQQSGRRPLYVLHRSGNPTVQVAQQHVIDLTARRWPQQNAAAVATVAPRAGGEAALPFVPPEEREPSRRVRSLLFVTLAVAGAVAQDVAEVYLCENGVLSAGIPLASSRGGSMSTHSTHPLFLSMFSKLCARLGLEPRLTNPFLYQTKGDLSRDVLKPALSPADIEATVSCWAAGRKPRQCGGCVPCLLRRVGMLYAGLPDEAYMIDVLGEPQKYVGTDAYGNLVDLLRSAQQLLSLSDEELMAVQPDLLELQAAGVGIQDVIATLRRHAEQVREVVQEHFPQAAALISV